MKPQLSSKPSTTGAAAAPGPLASFARFVLCGGGVGLLSSGAVALLAVAMPWVLANALITVASTILCTELHARFTFGGGKRAGWRQHWQSAGSATAAYAVTCVAMFVLHLVQPSPGMLTEQIVYLSASGLAGIGRFLVLRLYVFAAGRSKSTVSVVPVTLATPVAPEVQVPSTVRRTILRAPVTRGIGGLRTSPQLAVS
ncbi:GtrA family protein [Streptomyces sp. GQFP]|uniref:GtrA family protein n=1 Tax=Streptomyces sp. GQFP TaxID=2907545 RepID=UPI001F17148D|nr:GtrA family protein [Streptomyces sp. GQFP]UIX32614.1 GtrA family protein [Streptomyces sp. GQFP]